MDETPSKPGQSGVGTAVTVGKATVQRFTSGGGTDRAAAMAYYAIQAVFPGLLVVVILSLLFSSPEAVTDLVDRAVDAGLDPGAGDALNNTLQDAAARASGGRSSPIRRADVSATS